MALIDVAVLSDTVFEVNTGTLLNHVCGFVGCRVQVGPRGTHSHLAVHGVGMGSQLVARFSSLASAERTDTADVVMSERPLYGREVWQRLGGPCEAVAGNLMDLL